MDSFHEYIKKQLSDYVEQERAKGIPLEKIEEVLLNAGHGKNIIDEVFQELEKENAGQKKTQHKDPVENDLITMLKQGFEKFMAQASKKEVKQAQKDFEKTDTGQVVQGVIEEAEVIEEKLILESATFFVYLIIIGVIILFTAGAVDATVTKVAIGFSPALINAFLSFLGVNFANIVPLYMFIPLLVSSIFFVVGRFSGLSIFNTMDIESLAVINFLFAFAFNISEVYMKFIKPRSMQRRIIRPTTKSNRVREIFENNGGVSRPRQEISDLRREFKI